MKPSSTGYGIAKGGLGERLDPPRDSWFLARISAAATDGTQNLYSLVEVVPKLAAYGYEDKQGGLSADNASEWNNATVSLGTIVNARFRAWTDTGPTFEFQAGAGGGGASSIIANVHAVAGPDWPTTPSDWFCREVEDNGIGGWTELTREFGNAGNGVVYEHARLPIRCVDPDDGTVSHEIPLYIDATSGDYTADPTTFVGYVEWPDWTGSYLETDYGQVTNIVQNGDCSFTWTQTLTYYLIEWGFFNTPNFLISRTVVPPPPP